MKNIISGLMIYDIQQSMKKLGWEQESWEPGYAKIASDAGGACERSSRLVIEIGARFAFFFSSTKIFGKKCHSVTFLGTQELSSTGYRDFYVTLSHSKKKSVYKVIKAWPWHFFSSTGIPYRMDTGKTRVLKKIPGTGISKNLGTGRKYGTFFGPFFGSIFGHFLPLLTKRVKNVHFWKKNHVYIPYITNFFDHFLRPC